MTSPRRLSWRLPVLTGVLLLVMGTPGATQERRSDGSRERALLKELTSTRRAANARGIKAQESIGALSDETDELFAKHNAALKQLEALRSYNQTMREIVGSQDEELASLRGQLEQVDAVGRSVTPLMWRMIAALESFVELDTPFLIEDRRERLEELRELMVRAEVPVSEKYRVIMESYQLEAEYGRTIEAYRAPLLPGSGETVDFLRFGRVALVYLALDESEAGVWDPESRSWKVLDSSFHGDVRTGMRIARKQIAPDLIYIPLPPPEEGQASQAREGAAGEGVGG